MLFLVGFLVALCITQFIGLSLAVKEIDLLRKKIANFLPVVNIIHLGLKNSEMTTKLVPVTLSIRPEDFRIRADKLRDKLLEGLATKKHPDTGTRAYCILSHAGFEEYVESKSRGEIQEALTRHLLNGDDEATKRFIETVADSVAISTEVASEI
ncbi:MAG: hypothetical protein NTY93_00475 [Candidatus Kaiserbacteria bacterium]|nr:hypothetical protein [Candidatus Kaiserbacteria bacterium]